MIPEPSPKWWTDRKIAFIDNPDWPAPLEQRVSDLTDESVLVSIKNLTVVAIDPGGTTGWSAMKVDYHDLIDMTRPVSQTIHTWYRGQIDCGAMSGNAGDGATANDYGLGVSETGEAAGIALLERVCLNACGWSRATAVVIEDFVIDPRRLSTGRDFLSPIRVTAGLNQLLWEGRSVTLHRQTPADAKTTCSDVRLEKWGFWIAGNGGRHARDADRHALLFFRRLRQNGSRIRSAFPVVAEAHRRGLLGLPPTDTVDA